MVLIVIDLHVVHKPKLLLSVIKAVDYLDIPLETNRASLLLVYVHCRRRRNSCLRRARDLRWWGNPGFATGPLDLQLGTLRYLVLTTKNPTDKRSDR